jgi:multidrug resistance efflux pump
MTRFAVVLVVATLVSLCLLTPIPVHSDEGQAPNERAQTTEEKADEKAEEKSDQKDKPAGDKASTNGEVTKEKENAETTKEKTVAEEKKEAASDDAEEKPSAETKAKPSAKAETKKRKTFKVEPKRLKIELPLDGVFVASEMTEVPFRPEAWSDYEIVEVAKLGTRVRQGETLFKFDDRKLNEAIADLELDQRLNELAIRRAEEELPRQEKTLTMDLTAAERSDREAKEDFKRYTEIDRPMIVKSANFTAKYYQFMLDYEQDELDQLEKMYEADDLTEETEEIVLKRQKNQVEFAEFSLESAKLTRDETLDIRLPRYDVEIKESLERTSLALARARMAMQLDLNRLRYELEQRKQARVKSLDRHAKLIVDRGLMEIKAPADGIVYYGQCVNGRWGETQSLLNKYEPKNNVSPGSILMTIVDPRPIYVMSTFDEGKRPEVAVGQKVKFSPPAEGSQRINGKVKEISPIPVSAGKFEIKFDLEQDELPDWIVAGMSCKLKVCTYDEADALAVPKAAVRTDKEDEDQKYVWLVDPDDEEAKPTRRNVTIGRRSADDIEIVKGLKKGDVISLDDESDEAKKDA